MIEYDFKNHEIADIVNNMFIYAASKNASDMHFDPGEDGVHVRFRIDGLLQDHTIVPLMYQRNLTTRIKLIANMNITESRLPQDGAIKSTINGIDLDMRVSSLPTNLGEKIVIRLLDYSQSANGLEFLGFSPANYEKIKKMISVPNGIILITGATGSGKSTTVYTMLQTLNNKETNIITVEDPIEMNIEGINQVQVNSEIGLNFARVLRSILRQDPNIILIGEIRDTETAQIAVRASITGHLVFSTIHTNNSLSTIERLLDMNVERYLLSSALEGIVSQKLARRLCNKCKKLRPTTIYEKDLIYKNLKINVDEIYDVGDTHCDECRNGYHGRIAIQEVLLIDDHIRDAINNPNLSRDELRKLVYTDNTITLLQDGLQKVVDGITSFSEIFKLIEIEDELDNKIEKEKIQEMMKKEKEDTLLMEEIEENSNQNNSEVQTSNNEEIENNLQKTEVLDLSSLQ